MILDLFVVVLPVFLVIAAGYGATRSRLFRPSAVDGLMVFTQNFAVPCLLFRGVATLDLEAVFDWRLLVAFYAGALACFALATFGAKRLFRRRPGESVAVGFAALYSNGLLLGLPIMERAYGAGALAPNFAILAVHAPLCYLAGITVMELARADGRSILGTMRVVLNAMFRNALMIGLALGFAVNLSEIELPEPGWIAIDMMAASALPAALFGLGGILTRYALRTSMGELGMVLALSLLLHPAITFALAHAVFALPADFVRGAVVTAAMAPGVNVYVFASLYNRAQAQAASAVLLGTGACVLTAALWLAILETLP